MVRSTFKRKTSITLLVLGGCGPLGSKIVNYLAIENRVIVADWRLNAGFEGNCNIRFVPYDKMHNGVLTSFLDGVDVVIHLISTLLPENEIENSPEVAADNIFTSIRLLIEVMVYGGIRIMFVSSGGSVYGDKWYVPNAWGDIKKAHRDYVLAKTLVEKAVVG